MAILFSNEILSAVQKELQKAAFSVQIITAYCKEQLFRHLNDFISPSVKERKLMVRFRMDDVIKGSTDFAILETAMNLGWDVYVRFDLHAKTYIVDSKRGLVGSANATNSGLNIGKSGNMEMATLVDIESRDVEKIEKLFNDAIKIDDSLVEKLREQIDKVKMNGKTERIGWDSSITRLFSPYIDTLFSYELPEDYSMNIGEYFAFLDEIYDGNFQNLKEKFRWSNAYLWLLTILRVNGGCMYFGAISTELHDALVSDPKPYRRDVKQMLVNMLSLIEDFEMEEVVIDRPNYSQRVRLKEYVDAEDK